MTAPDDDGFNADLTHLAALANTILATPTHPTLIRPWLDDLTDPADAP